jgi:competence protein ComFB
MSEKQNYQKHIEQAIQNVLKKVKNPDFEDANVRPQAPEHTHSTGATSLVADLARARPVAVKSRSPLHQNKLTQARKIPTRQTPSSETESSTSYERPETSSQSTERVHQDKKAPDLSDSPLIDGEDLYVLQPLDPSEIEDAPEIDEDPYEAPYNLFEEFVETELNILLSRYVDLCHCSQCRSDIVALALQQLPAYYVTGTRGTLTAKSVVWTRYMQEVMDAVNKAIHIVYKRPRSSCKRIKHMLWVKPELEEVSGPSPRPEQFSDTILEQDAPDLNLSDEITEIIQTLEQANAEDKAQLLPVFSEHVHARVQNAYQQLEDITLTTEEEPEDMQLLEIEDWE